MSPKPSFVRPVSPHGNGSPNPAAILDGSEARMKIEIVYCPT